MMPESSKIYPTAKIASNCTVKMGKNCFIGDFVFAAVEELEMLDGSQINAHTSITGGKGKVRVGRNSVISYGVRILTRTDTPRGKRMNDASPESDRKIRSGNVLIGDNVFVGANAVLMPNVIIGENSVIGSGCYVNKDVLANMILIPEQRLIYKARKL